MRLFIWIENNLKNFYNRIERNVAVDAESLSYYRILTGFFFICTFDFYNWLGEIPNTLYKPNVLTIAALFDGFPPTYFFTTADFIRIILLILITLGVRSRTSLILLSIVLFVEKSFLYGFGKIDHSIFEILLLLCLALTDSGSKNALLSDRKLNKSDTSIAIYSIFIVFAFFSAGYEKFFNWLDFDISTNGVLSWFYAGYLNLGRDQLLADVMFHLPLWVLEIMDYAAVLFELTGIFFLLGNRKSWYTYILIAIIFHFSITLFLNISFTTKFVFYGIWIATPFLKNNKWLILFIIILLQIPELYKSFVFGLFSITLAILVFFSIHRNNRRRDLR